MPVLDIQKANIFQDSCEKISNGMSTCNRHESDSSNRNNESDSSVSKNESTTSLGNYGTGIGGSSCTLSLGMKSLVKKKGGDSPTSITGSGNSVFAHPSP